MAAGFLVSGALAQFASLGHGLGTWAVWLLVRIANIRVSTRSSSENRTETTTMSISRGVNRGLFGSNSPAAHRPAYERGQALVAPAFRANRDRDARRADARRGRKAPPDRAADSAKRRSLLRTIRGAREFSSLVKAALSEARLPRLWEHCLGESRVALRVCRSARHVRRQNSPVSPS
jgi:hypothetical protein